MNVKKTLILFFISMLFVSCNNKLPLIPIQEQISRKVIPLSKENLRNWHFKDIVEDTIPGISLNKAYKNIIKNKKGKEVIVAVIDTEIDIHHESLKDVIWINTKEIPKNHIDDDNNGYIDDIYGWNFLGKHTKFVNYEYTRILRKYNPIFKNKEIGDIALKDTSAFHIYKKCQIRYDKSMEYAIANKKNYDLLYHDYYQARRDLISYFPHEKYTLKKLDSLKKTTNDTLLVDDIVFMTELLGYNVTESYVINNKEEADERINKLLGLTYNDRLDIGDNPKDITDIGYGTNKVNNNINYFKHGTKMAGIIASNNNKLDENGISDNVKIMSLVVAAYGDEHDKDIALAIKYAVDNGAKVINMSFVKEFSLQYKWVEEALKYAEKNEVLIVNAAGNSKVNLDKNVSFGFPNDHGYFDDLEILTNYLKVGASDKILNKNLKASYSNYGKKEVDVFAPGKNIYTTLPNNKYTNESGGTSSASAITSGVAALIFSYYPNLKAHQVKKIIMDSGVEYTIEVSTPTKEDKNKTTPFNQLSKSGKVVNAYNALIMAERISKN